MTAYIDFFVHNWWVWPAGIPALFILTALWFRFRKVPFRTAEAGLHLLYVFLWPLAFPIWWALLLYWHGLDFIGKAAMWCWKKLAVHPDVR